MIGIRIGADPGPHIRRQHGSSDEPEVWENRASWAVGKPAPVFRHGDARTVNLPIDDIADCDYENPNSTHPPRGVGVVEDIIHFPETPLGINCALCALPRT